jgi:hypothetical protein
VVAALVRHNVRKLTSTYITLSLKDIAASAGLPSPAAAETLLRKMIAAGEISAKINQESGMVRFGEDDGDGAAEQAAAGTGLGGSSSSSSSAGGSAGTAALLRTLEQHITEGVAVSERLRTLQQHVLTSAEYISRSSQSSFSRAMPGGKGGGFSGGRVGGEWGAGDGDFYVD